MRPQSDGFEMSSLSDEDYLAMGTSSGLNEMDLEMASPDTQLPVYFFPSKEDNEYVDPNAIGGREESPVSTPIQSNVGRMYPGMHQQQAQQAALAKAEQQRSQQRRIQEIRQQQIQQRQQEQQQHASATMAAQNGAGQQQNPNAHEQKDMHVERTISSLLQKMRQSSVTSNEDDAATPNANGAMQRMKKDEDDMDDDERLLASEEGKKLSSKERRQLRNKVSARAFRSRRKGSYMDARIAHIGPHS